VVCRFSINSLKVFDYFTVIDFFLSKSAHRAAVGL
jgi:hypothetical protein